MRKKLLSVLLVFAMIVSTFASLSVFASETVSSCDITAGCDRQTDFSTAYTGKVKISFTLNVAAGTGGNANINFYLYPKGTDRTAAQAVIQLSGRQFYAQQESATDRRIDFETDSAVVFEYDLSASQYTVSVNGSDPAGPYNAKGTQANVGGMAWKDNLGSVGTIKNLTVETVGGTQESQESGTSEHTPKTYEVYATDTKDEIDTAISGLLAGDTLIFHEGTYNMNLRSLRSSGTAEKPIVIKGAEGEEKPLILNTNENANLWEIYGNHVVIENMAFENDVNLGVRLCQNADGNGLSDVTVQNCTFIASNEVAVAANLNDAVYKDIKILNNDFIGLKKTAIYIGSHSGSTSGTGIEVRGNFFDGREITDPNVTGYALELKKNIVGAVVEENLFINPKGPAIATYGSDNDGMENANIIRYNIVGGSRENCGIIVCAGPAIVQNNIALSNEYIGIGLQNYNGWNMLRDILMTGNTSGILYDPTCPDDYTGLSVSDKGKNITVEDNIFYKELPGDTLKKLDSVLEMNERPVQENLDAAFALMKEKDTDEALSVEELTAVLDALLGGNDAANNTVFGKITASGNITPEETADFTLSAGNLHLVNVVQFSLEYNTEKADFAEYELLAENGMMVNFKNEEGVVSGALVLTKPASVEDFSDLVKFTFTRKGDAEEIRIQLTGLKAAGIASGVGAEYGTVILTRDANARSADPLDTNRDGRCDFGDVAEAMKYFNWSADANYSGFVCGCSDACYHESDGVNGLDWNDAVHADVNGDGIIDIVDILLILDAIR